MSSTPTPIFLKSAAGALFVFLLGCGTLFRSFKQKDDFLTLTGEITYLAESIPVEGQLNLNNEKIRYLQIEGSPTFFRLFLEPDLDGSKPPLDKVNSLKTGDVVTLYYDENFASKGKEVSYLTQFIYKNQKPYFIRGNHDKLWGSWIIGFSGIVFTGLLLLKKAGKIS